MNLQVAIASYLDFRRRDTSLHELAFPLNCEVKYEWLHL